MSYKTDRSVGFQKWGVTNPWVWANYGQPQRQRGTVSPMVFQTETPHLKSAHLGQSMPDDLELVQAELRRANAELKRAARMETIAIAGLVLSGVSVYLAWQFHRDRKMAANRRRRRRRVSRRRRR